VANTLLDIYEKRLFNDDQFFLITRPVVSSELTTLFRRFTDSERSGGIVLIFCTALSLVLTNLGVTGYIDFWNIPLGSHSLLQWINDGLMTIFFLLIGLELEREIYIGELSNVRKALLPVFAAMGGMIFPAGIFLALNWNGDRSGTGIPMATDIAFALGVLSMLGKHIPGSLKIFLTALAVIDDLGAIIVIAVFYTASVDLQALGVASAIFVFLMLLNRMRIHNLIPYVIGGALMWYYMLSSGIHATITGVLLAFAIPFGKGDEKSPSYILQDFLHIPVAYFILPVFALANTCIPLTRDALAGLGTVVSLGIMAGLVIGKPLGILFFTYLATAFKISAIPQDLRWVDIAGAGILAGIGFTMSIFIALLAFDDPALVDAAKLSIMVGSLCAGIIGVVWLHSALKRPSTSAPRPNDRGNSVV
jgi:Na+:H+ antiporter, NhaA family